MAKLRVLHAPYQAPYTRKLFNDHFAPINGTLNGNMTVPRGIDPHWLANLPDLRWFDVLHLHSLDKFSITELHQILTRCHQQHRGVVYTFHDLIPLHGSPLPEFSEKIELTNQADVVYVFLTSGSQSSASSRWQTPQSSFIIPHGSHSALGPRELEYKQAAAAEADFRHVRQAATESSV